MGILGYLFTAHLFRLNIDNFFIHFRLIWSKISKLSVAVEIWYLDQLVYPEFDGNDDFFVIKYLLWVYFIPEIKIVHFSLNLVVREN